MLFSSPFLRLKVWPHGVLACARRGAWLMALTAVVLGGCTATIAPSAEDGEGTPSSNEVPTSSDDEPGIQGGGGNSTGAGGGGGISPAAPNTLTEASLSIFDAGKLVGVAQQQPEACPGVGTTVTPSKLSSAFATACAGCHGAKGQGIGAFPPLTAKPDFAAYMNVVRKGRNDTMPAFGKQHVSDAQIFRDWVTLQGREATVPRFVECSPEAQSDTWTSQRYAQAITQGLAAWRQPDNHDGAACAGCHGPAPFDLAYIGHDDGTIMRRALMHLPEREGFAIVEMVHALRAKFSWSAPANFQAFRPFQPGGRVLGADPTADLRDQENRGAQADHLFGLELEKALPALAGAALRDVAAAKRARDEFLKINPRTFPIAIALNRWTEDKHHGVAHASLADWIPDKPHLPRDAAATRTLYELHDEYLRKPSWNGVTAVEDGLGATTKMSATGVAGELFALKYKSVLYAQHEFLLQMAGRPGLAELGPAPFPNRNPVWAVGDLARVNRANARACMNSWICLGLTSETAANIDASQPVIDEIERIKFSWFWVGWQFDVSLYRTSDSNATNSAEYFLEHLYERRYYNHAWYMRVRKNLAVAYELADVQGGRPPGALGAGAQNWRYAFEYGRGLNDSNLPPMGAERELYLRLMANAARMVLLLAEEELKQISPTTLPPEIKALPESGVVSFLATHGDGTSDTKLIESVRALIGQKAR